MRRYFVYVALMLVVVINYADRVNLSLAAGPLRHDLGLSPVQLGFVFSSFSWTYIICLLPLGYAVDRFGARAMLSAALAVWSLGGMLTGLAAGLPVLLASRLVLGAGEAVTYPAGGRIIRDWVPRRERGFAQAMMSSGQAWGPAIGSVLIGLLIARLGWQKSFFITGGIGLVFAVLLAVAYRQPEDADWISAEERGMIIAGRDPTRGKAGGSQALGGILRNPTMWALAALQGCGIYTQYLFVNWLPSYLQAASGFDVRTIGILTAAPFVFSGSVLLCLARLNDRLLSSDAVTRGSRRILIGSCLVASSIIMLMPAVAAPWLKLVIISISLASAATASSMNVALANDLLRDGEHAGAVVSFVLLGGNLFGAAAPVITGYAVASSFGYDGAFAIAGILSLIGAAICFGLTRGEIRIGSSPKVA